MAAGDPSVSCDPALPCLTPAWNASILAGSHGLCHCLQGHLSPPWSQQPQSLLAALHLFFLLSKYSFYPGWPVVPQPCSVSAPPETMSPLLTVLPLMCHSAGRPAVSSHQPSLSKPSFRRSVQRGPERRRLTCPAERSSPAHRCQLHLHCPGLGSNPSQQHPFIRPAATSCNQK